jgi:hypothetical protein
MILGIAQTIPLEWISGSWINAVSFGLLIAVLLFRPNGLVSGVRKSKRRSNSNRRPGAGLGQFLARTKQEAGTIP